MPIKDRFGVFGYVLFVVSAVIASIVLVSFLQLRYIKEETKMIELAAEIEDVAAEAESVIAEIEEITTEIELVTDETWRCVEQQRSALAKSH